MSVNILLRRPATVPGPGLTRTLPRPGAYPGRARRARRAVPAAARLRLWADLLEVRLAPAVLDLTIAGAVASLDNAPLGNPVVFGQVSPQSTGSGVVNPFVRIQQNGVEQGYNSDFRDLSGDTEFDEPNNPTFNHSLLLSSVPRVNVGGRMYREFVLDINESGGDNSLLSLDELRFYISNSNTLHGYDPLTKTLGGLNPVYDLDAGGNNWIKLDARIGSGSGTGDMRAFIPDGLFNPSQTFVAVYSKFGVQPNLEADDGFEEWFVGAAGATVPTGRVHGYTFQDTDGDGADDGVLAGDPRLSGVTTYLDANTNGTLDDGEATTTTGTNGEYAFRGLAAGLGTFSTYRVREVVPAAYTQTTANPPAISLLTGDVYMAVANQPAAQPLALGETQKVEPGLAFGNKKKNDAPVANNDAYATSEDTTLTVAAPGVLANDTDADDDTLTAVLVSGPSNGSLTLNANGSFTYTPAANFNGTDSFRYKANDGEADSNTATVTITVTPVNDAPVAANDAYTTNEDTPLVVPAPGVLGNDTDVDGNPLTAVFVAGPSHGTVVLNADGSFTYTPNANYNGPDSFTYRASDGTALSNVATVSLTVHAANDAPVAVNDAYSTAEDTTLTVGAPGVLANDTDVDGNPLTAVLVSGPANGTLTLNSNGSFTYTPAANFNGADTFTYKANDGQADSNVATVTITVTPVNDAPVAANDAYATNEDTPLVVPAPGVLGNDTDADGDSLAAVLVSGPSNGTLLLNADGSFTYTPNANYNGPDSFTYRASDGTALSNVATVSLTVHAANDAPVAVNDAYATNEDQTLVVSAPGVLGNDSDADGDTLTAVLVTGPSHGALALNADGSFTYTPVANYNGPDTFTYRAFDGAAFSNVATVTLTVNAVNDAPVAAPDGYTTPEDTTLTVAAPGVLMNDTDVDGDGLSALLVTGVSHGTLTLNADGSFTYTPAANFNGSDSFTYKANDGTADSNTVTVALTVTAVNDAPVAAPDGPFTTAEDTPLTVPAPGVLANDTDVDGDALVAVLPSDPAHGTVVLNPNGSFTYTPDANYNGPDSFTYQASDGQALSNVVTVSITVTAVNDAPVAAPDSYSTDEDTTLHVAAPGVLSNDTDVDGDTITAVLVSGPAHGTLTLNANGSFTYTPAANYNGSDSFQYKANDGSMDSNVATVLLTVKPVNDAPVANDDAYSTNEDTPLVVLGIQGVLANDTDVDGDPLTAVLVSGPSHGMLTLLPDGGFSYTPAANYNGPDSFTYQAKDPGGALSNVATVRLTVTAANDAPVAVPDSYSTNEDSTLTVAAPGVLGNDLDVDGDSLTAVLVSGPSHGTLTLNANGSFTYTPAANYNGPDSFMYKARDPSGAESEPATVTITVHPVNDRPTVSADQSVVVDDEGGTPASNTGTYGDIDGDVVTLTASVGVVVPTGPGTWRWEFQATDGPAQSQTVTITADDGHGGVATTSFQLTVKNVPPTITEMVCPVAPQPAGTPVAVTAHFQDPGISQGHLSDGPFTAVFDWGDGTTSGGTVTELPGGGDVSGTHTYTAAGVYTVSLTLWDKDGGRAFHECDDFVVIFGLDTKVTGGGWIQSPRGAMPASPTATGKANFGFNAKYHLGSTTPTGETNFRFAPGRLHFHSTSYDPVSLIVTSPAPGVQRAEWRGSGWINGAGDYAFKVMVIDAGEPGSSDKFRIRIWDKVTQAVIYDNEPLAPDAASPTTVIGGGNIQVHNFLELAGPAGSGGAAGETLTGEALAPILEAAVGRWAAAGEAVGAPGTPAVRVADLPGALLGVATPGTIWIDQDGAGYGWFVDPTPADDHEFAAGGPAPPQVDLLTVVAHELGHLLGFEHGDGDEVMAEALPPGVRLLPEPVPPAGDDNGPPPGGGWNPAPAGAPLLAGRLDPPAPDWDWSERPVAGLLREDDPDPRPDPVFAGRPAAGGDGPMWVPQPAAPASDDAPVWLGFDSPALEDGQPADEVLRI